MDFLARVNPKYFAAINLFSAVQDVRYYLNSVYVEPHPEKGVVIVATNGHVMGLIHDPDGWAERPIIVGSITKALTSACMSKGSKKEATVPTALFISERGAVVHCGEEAGRSIDPFSEFTTHLSRIDLIEAVYPDWRKVLPKKRDRSEQFPCIQAGYLALIERVAKILVGPNRFATGIELESRGRDLSVVARFAHPELSDRFVGVIMPLRQDHSLPDILPAWLMPTPESEASPTV